MKNKLMMAIFIALGVGNMVSLQAMSAVELGKRIAGCFEGDAVGALTAAALLAHTKDLKENYDKFKSTPASDKEKRAKLVQVMLEDLATFSPLLRALFKDSEPGRGLVSCALRSLRQAPADKVAEFLNSVYISIRNNIKAFALITNVGLGNLADKM